MPRDLRIKAVIEAENRTDAATTAAQSGFSKLTEFLKARFVITLGDVARATRAVVDVFSDIIQASAEEEAAVNALRTALAPLGAGAERVTAALVRQATALQNTTAFSDDAILAGQRLAATFTRDEATIKKITQAAVDLAASGRIELEPAFLLLGRAAAGATETLGRYGIEVDKTLTSSEQLADIFRQITDQVGGQAVAQVNTYAGAIAQLRNQFGEALQVFGDAIIKNQEVLAAIRATTEFIKNNGAPIVLGLIDAFKSLVSILSALAPALGVFVDAIKLLGIEAAKVKVGVDAGSGATTRFGAAAGKAVPELGAAAASTGELGVAAEDAAPKLDAAAKSTASAGAAAVAADPEISSLAEVLENLGFKGTGAEHALEQLNASLDRRLAVWDDAAESQRNFAASLDETAASAERAGAAIDQFSSQADRARAAGRTPTSAEEAGVAGIVGGIRQVSTRARTAADTQAALLRRNIEALRSSVISPGAGVIQRLQRQLAILESADFGTTDDTRSLA